MTRRRRGLSPEERELWSRYSRTTAPLRPATPEMPADIVNSPAKRSPEPTPRIEPFVLGDRRLDRGSTFALAPSISDEVRAAPLRMDAKAHRRMTSGKLRPEAKLDLHGMTLDAAHPALTGFILSAQASGKRLVIVVTGKGKVKPGDGPIPARLGVLRHQVPQWLGMAPLASAVLQVSEAHRNHGGSGAYYVYLRRR